MVITLIVPSGMLSRALGVGYDNIAQMLPGTMPPAGALALLAVKAII
jgi:hypothetical protein